MFSPLNIHLRQSRTLLIVEFGCGLISVVSVVASSLDGMGKVYCYTFIFLVLLYCYFRYQQPPPLRSLFWDANKKLLRVKLDDQCWYSVSALIDKRCYSVGIWVKMKVVGRRYPVSMIIMRDTLSIDNFRKLSVFVRYAPVADSKQSKTVLWELFNTIRNFRV